MDRISQLRRFGLFDAGVPRYTSYPTPPHFSDAVTDDVAAGWISALPAGATVSLYVHIPFCRRLCWFCACRTQGVASDAPVRAYVEVLRREIDLLAARLPAGVRLSRLHLGGGTPTLLPPATMTDLVARLTALAERAPGFEVSVEVDPCEIDDTRMDALAGAGMTRASVGVQDFHPSVQRAIGRVQSFDATRKMVEGLRRREVSVSLDALYGLPGQTAARQVDTLHKVLALAPDRISLLGYAHVPRMSRRQRLIPAADLPGGQARLHVFETAARLLEWDGFRRVGTDHFVRPGDALETAWRARLLRRTFQGYTDDPADALIGLGASAVSRLPQGYAQNAPRTADYIAAIGSGCFATRRGHALSDADRMAGVLIEELMCFGEIDANRAALRSGASRAACLRALASLTDAFADALTVDSAGLRVRPGMEPLIRPMAARLDAYGPFRHNHVT